MFTCEWTAERRSGHDYLARVARDAAEMHSVPSSLTHEASRITARRLSHLMGGTPSVRGQNRIYAYFWGVVRHSSIGSRGSENRVMRERYLMSSIVSDLRQAGRSGSDIVAEIESSYRDAVAPEVLLEFRSLLCG